MAQLVQKQVLGSCSGRYKWIIINCGDCMIAHSVVTVGLVGWLVISLSTMSLPVWLAIRLCEP